MNEISQSHSISLAKWVTDGTFRTDMDVIEFEVKGKNGENRTKKRGFVRMDILRSLMKKEKLTGHQPGPGFFWR